MLARARAGAGADGSRRGAKGPKKVKQTVVSGAAGLTGSEREQMRRHLASLLDADDWVDMEEEAKAPSQQQPPQVKSQQQKKTNLQT